MLSATSPITLGQGAWIVAAGRVHVFAVQLKGGKPASARRYLFSVDAPGMLFALPRGPAALGLVAVAEPGSRVEPAEEGAIWRSPELVASVEQWVSGWMAGCVRYLQNRPRRERAASLGRTVDLPVNGLVDGGHTVVWYRVESGEGVLFDTESVGGDGPRTFPLAAGGWVRAFEPMRLVPLATHELAADGTLPRVLDDFMLAAECSLATVLNFALVDEVMRIDRRQGRLATDFRSILGELGSMVGGEAPQSAAPAANQALFLAVHAVAARMGVKAQMPVSVRQEAADVEPSLDDIVRASGLRARPVTLTGEWWTQGLGSMLVFAAEDRHPMALLEQAWGGYVLDDAATGRRRTITPALAATLARDAICLYQPLPDTPLTLGVLVKFGLQDCRNDVLAMAGAALLGGWLGSLPAVASTLIFDILIPQRMPGLLWQVAAALCLLALARALFVFAGDVAFARLRARASTRLKAGLWDRLLRQPTPFFSRFSAPDLGLRVSTVETMVGAIHTLVHQSAMTAALLVGNLVTMVWLSPAAAPAALGMIAVLAAAIVLAAWAQMRAFKSGEQALGSVSNFLHALTNGVRKLRLAGAEERAFVKWGERFTRSRLKLIEVRKVTNGFSTFAVAFNTGALAALLALIALLNTDPVEVGAFFGFITAFGMATAALTQLGLNVLNVAFQLAAVPYGQPVLDAVPDRQARKSDPGRLSGAVEIANLGFRYATGGEAILAGLSLRIDPGEAVALVGPTGCGKSTLVKLLLGLEAPTGGAILYDQRDLAGLDAEGVRRQIGVVLQRPQLVPASLFETIRGTSEASLDEVWEAARIAGIAADIEAMPMGMYTIIGEGAQGWSGGQVQRIALARAVVRKPALLILDEATSALDNLTQADITSNLARLASTRIIIAHRLSTIVGADRIVVIDGGRVVQQGTHAELMAGGGLFARMAARQDLKTSVQPDACVRGDDYGA